MTTAHQAFKTFAFKQVVSLLKLFHPEDEAPPNDPSNCWKLLISQHDITSQKT
jgi:hypothetical protein